MTVCIAAVCNVGADRQTCVVAACDRMITIGDLEYEPMQRKVTELGSTTIAMFAGDMQLHAAVVPKTHARLKALLADRDPPRLLVEEIAEAYALEFAFYRRTLAEREVLFPRGMDFERFARQQSMLPHYQVSDIDARLAAHAIDSTAIIAGLDHTGGHIYVVRDPGVADSLAISCFACAGSGKDIAATQFMVAKYDKQWPLSKSLWLTFSAKARAEVAGGVGPQTDLIVISPGKIEYGTESHTAGLYDLFKQVRDKESAAQEEVIATLEASGGPAAQPQRSASPDQDAAAEPAKQEAETEKPTPISS